MVSVKVKWNRYDIISYFFISLEKQSLIREPLPKIPNWISKWFWNDLAINIYPSVCWD